MSALLSALWGLLVSHISHSLGARPLELFALLLLKAPDVLTLRTLLALEGLHDDNHQLAAEDRLQRGHGIY